MKKTPTNIEKKFAIRSKMKKQRSALTKEERIEYSDKIMKNMETFVNMFDYNSYFIYDSINHEVSTKDIIKYLIDEGKDVYLPRIEDDGQMVAVKINEDTMFTISKFGTLEPEGIPTELDDFVCITPCLAIDKDGNRLGYGKGYYDRFLEGKNCLKVAVAYDFQKCEEVPTEKHDVPVDVLITPTQFNAFNHQNKLSNNQQQLN